MICISLEHQNTALGAYRIDLANETKIYARDRTECMVAVDHYFGGNGHTKRDHPQCPICRDLAITRGQPWSEDGRASVGVACEVKYVREEPADRG